MVDRARAPASETSLRQRRHGGAGPRLRLVVAEGAADAGCAPCCATIWRCASASRPTRSSGAGAGGSAASARASARPTTPAARSPCASTARSGCTAVVADTGVAYGAPPGRRALPLSRRRGRWRAPPRRRRSCATRASRSARSTPDEAAAHRPGLRAGPRPLRRRPLRARRRERRRAPVHAATWPIGWPQRGVEFRLGQDGAAASTPTRAARLTAVDTDQGTVAGRRLRAGAGLLERPGRPRPRPRPARSTRSRATR